jgi:CP family cyanate transporter-like MFS transporter
MSGGATLAAGGTVPLQDATGIGWRPAIAVWAIPAALAAILWLPQLRRQHRDIPVDHPVRAVRGLWHDRVAWSVTAFMGLQSLGFYAGVAWIPTLLTDHGISSSDAGLLLAASALISLPGSLFAPGLAARFPDQRIPVAATVALIATGFAGLIVAPVSVPLVWMLLIGLGQGGSIALALTMIGLRSPDSEHAGKLSSMAQGVGYLIASVGPFALGVVHEASGGWSLPMVVLLVLLVPQLLAGLSAGRTRLVAARGAGGAPPVAPASSSGA